jgi:methanogenic corrinoid protein MtbC1
MTRTTPQALSTDAQNDAVASNDVDSDAWSEVHRLPFNTDSPTWLQKRLERPEAEERMSRLVKTLEAEVIPRLVEAYRSAPMGEMLPAVVSPTPTAGEVEEFVQLLLHRDDASVSKFIATLRSRGMSIEVVFLELLAAAASHLGALWEEDRCDFTAVTIALGRLQNLLRMLSPLMGAEAASPANAHRVLLVPAPGEQHTFGLSMVAEFFVHAGWEVASGRGAHRDEAIDMVSREWFDVIGFSVGSELRLDWLTTCIASVRQLSRNPAIGVLVGGPVFTANPEYAAIVGADATSKDGKQAPIAAEALIPNRVPSS